MTASTPPLVDVIAEALRQHDGATGDSLGTEVFCDGCGEGESPAPTDDKHQWHATHQARAVLDLLTEAGGVEVVTGYGVKLKSGDVERCGTLAQDAKELREEMAGWHDPDYNPVGVVTRTTTTITIRTDWTAVDQ